MKPLPFSDTFAHPGDLLPVHLERVAARSAASVAPSARPEVSRIAFLAGLFHDIGKATPYFQDYLLRTQRRTALTPHAKSGAVLSWWCTGTLGLALWQRLAVFLAVLRHHGALNCESWSQALESVRFDVGESDNPLAAQLAALDLSGIGRWMEAVASRHPAVFAEGFVAMPLTLETLSASLGDRRAAGRAALRQAVSGVDQALIFLAGFGALLATDKLDAALQGESLAPRPALPAGAVAAFLAQRRSAPSPLNALRTTIAAEVCQTWADHLDAPLLCLTAPTGSGKTLAIFNAALRARDAIRQREGEAPRLIYCLPFTSVIDQNHAVFRAVLGAGGIREREDVLLKHHHLVDGTFRTEDAEHAPDGAGQLLTETWRSEIVVTTFHQLVHSLLSPRNGDLKRAGQLTGALVLMDEVQALPLRYWEALRHLFQAAARALGARFVLLTATRPLIFRPDDAVELLPSHVQHFRALNRVKLFCHHREPIGLNAFTELLVQRLVTDPRPTLIILNRRRAVRELFERLAEAFPGRKLIALSTDLTPRDRRARIRLIQRLLRRREDCIVVSTQLVEAGVDISFPVVHRDLAPLDAVIQSAGRCNRHDLGDSPGEAHLWAVHQNRGDRLGGPLWQRVYDAPLIEVTERVLGERTEWAESDFLVLSQRYFEGCWQTQDQDAVDEWLSAGDFVRLGRDFQLIEDGPPRSAVFIVARESDDRLWQRYQAIHTDLALSPLEKDQRFRVIRAAVYERIVQIYAQPDPEQPISRLDAEADHYCRETGFIATIAEDSAACIL